MKVKTLIIPDVHGRTFWKDAVEKFPIEKFPNINIVFLGDYLDPYETIENISRRDAINNFLEICDTARKDKRIHLLIGNHDMHYFYNAPYKSRVDKENYEEISMYFEDEFDLFNVAWEEKVNRRKILYTHAGVTNSWLRHLHFVGNLSIKNNQEYHIDRLGNKVKKVSDEQLPFCQMLATMTPEAEKLNKMLHNFQGRANLWMCSWVRGGDGNTGSCIWADLEEWYYVNESTPHLWQIFGHTLRANGFDEAYIDKKQRFAMLDSRQAWVLDTRGHLHKLSEIEKGCN